MLEYALKQERSKFHKLKYGVELQTGCERPSERDGEQVTNNEQEQLPVTAPYQQGRQLIRQYFDVSIHPLVDSFSVFL